MQIVHLVLTEGQLHYSPLKLARIPEQELKQLMSGPGAVSFDEVVMISRRYAVRLDNLGYQDKVVILSYELAERLEQVNFLAKSLRYLAREYCMWDGKRRHLAPEDADQVYFLLHLYATSLYYIAFRVEKILRSRGPSKLPFVTGYPRNSAITEARNHLLEHQFDQKPNVGGRMRAVHSELGPLIVAVGTDGPPDAESSWVLEHALAFRDSVSGVLERGLQQLPTAPVPEEYPGPGWGDGSKKARRSTKVS